MRHRALSSILTAAGLIGVVLAACSDSSKESSIACSGGTPDLAGTWTLYTLDLGAGPIPNPPASGTFYFHDDSVDVDLNVPSPPAPQAIVIAGTGSCSLTGSRISINSNSVVLGQATGTFTFVQTPGADTLKANLVSSGQTINVVVTR